MQRLMNRSTPKTSSPKKTSGMDRHVVKLQLGVVPQSPIYQHNYKELNFEESYWKENLTRIQTTSRPEGRPSRSYAIDQYSHSQHVNNADIYLPSMRPNNLATAGYQKTPRLVAQ